MFRRGLLAAVILTVSVYAPLHAQSFSLRRTGGEVVAGYTGLRTILNGDRSDRELVGRLSLAFQGYAVSPSTLTLGKTQSSGEWVRPLPSPVDP